MSTLLAILLTLCAQAAPPAPLAPHAAEPQLPVTPALEAAAPTDAPAAGAGMPVAVAAYRNGQYLEASADFARLAASEDDPVRAGILHCNAGTAAARAEQFGESLWHLMRARQLLPRDPQTAANLERVQAMLATARANSATASASEAPAFARTLRELPLRATPDETDTLCGAAAGLALVLLALWRLGRLPRATVGVAVLLLAGAAGWWGFSREAWARDGRRAVVIAESVNGRAEPSAGSELLFHLSSGMVLTSEEQRGEWRLVQSDTGARGWVPADQVRPLL